MNKIGFDNQKYIDIQSQKIKERISKFGGKLYLEFGGKLFDDYHASRVLPGFEPDSKIRMLLNLKEQAEIVIVISADDIEKNKLRSDLGITYDMDILRLIDIFRDIDLFVGGVVITHFGGQHAAIQFEQKLKALGIKVYKHYLIDGYPSNIPLIISENGYGKNDYIETSRSLVVVTAPGPGSGKMAVCLSQLYHEHIRGIKSGYAKFETFPIWNLPLKHPTNLAYEAATADLNDVNMLDPFHLEAYGTTSVNYNRDVEVFPVLEAMFKQIYGYSPYKSPTDMGVNMAGFCIIDDKIVKDASRKEIIRRYCKARCNKIQGIGSSEEVYKIELLMKQADCTDSIRPCMAKAIQKEAETSAPAVCVELSDGRLITGKTSSLLGASSAALLNCLKALGNIPDDVTLISPTVIEPVQALKTEYLGNRNPRLHTDEVLVALSVCAVNDEYAKIAMNQLHKLKGCEAHSTVILSHTDENTFRKLGLNLTYEPKYQNKKLYHK